MCSMREFNFQFFFPKSHQMGKKYKQNKYEKKNSTLSDLAPPKAGVCLCIIHFFFNI